MMEAIASTVIDKGKNLLNLEDNLITVEINLKRLSCRASDLKQEVKRAEQMGKKKRKREVENWFAEVQQVENDYNELKNRIEDDGFLRNLSSGDRVGKLKARVELLMEQSRHFDGRLVLDDFDNIGGQPCLPMKLFGKKFKQTLERIWPCLVVDDISSIGIYGMGGVGKTTLAKHIKYHLEESDYCVHWVTVSQEFSVTGLQDKIANVLDIELSNKDEEEMRANILRVSFNKEQKFVLILDDVWEEFCVEKIGIPLGANKCRLILTTRSLQVCQRMCLQRNFDVTALDTNEAWELFKHTLGTQTVLVEEVEKVAKLAANRCSGLPLGIITVSGSMRGVSNIHEWRYALYQLNEYSIGYEEMEDKVFPVLEWSFNRLKGCERPCFLYCCLYPEDKEIDKDELINLFILAELIPRRNTKELNFDYGHKILNKLIKVCLLEETRKSSVKMHDLIRDMALRMTRGKSIREITGDVPRFLVKSTGAGSKAILEQNVRTEDLNAVSFILHNNHIEIPRGMSPICPLLSTLLFDYGKIDRIPDTFFRHMVGLKVLSLRCYCYLKELPNCISNLVNLTALWLEGCQELESVPPLGKLKQLRELNLSNTKVDYVPQGLEELIKLERLDMHDTRLTKKIIPKGTFSKLHHLQHLVLPMSIHVCDSEVLQQLQVFSGRLTFLDVFNQFITSQCWPKQYRIVVVEKPSCEFEDYSLYSNKMKNLMFYGSNFQKGLDVVLLPKDIRELKLVGCFGLSDDFFQHLINQSKDLVYLDIRSSEEVKFLMNLSFPPPSISFDHEQLESNFVAPLRKLKVLELHDLPNFVGIINEGLSSSSGGKDAYFRRGQQYLIPPGTISSLTQLYIYRCHKLKKLFTVELLQQSLQNLEDLHVKDCQKLEEIVANEDDQEIIVQPTSIGLASTTIEVRLPKLRTLNLGSLPVLENICKATMICCSIKHIWVFDCPKLERMPLSLPTNSTDGETFPLKICNPSTNSLNSLFR